MKKEIGLQRMVLGVCYYPEHWDETLWEDDLERMKEHGIEVIRIGEFTWSLLEPEEGVYDFSLFDRFLKLAAHHGIKVIFGTPTATPPAWLTHKYPEVLNAWRDGTLMRHGTRRHYNYNSPKYQELVREIVIRLGRQYGHHPAVIGWQIDNELNCGVDEFYSESDHQAFRRFLQERYGSLRELNKAWGTRFWSQTYTAWEQVYLQRTVPSNSANPHLALDEKRFISESAIRFCQMQSECLRSVIAPEQFITTNGIFKHLDTHGMVERALDFITYDNYPNFGYSTENPHPKLRDRYHSFTLSRVRDICPNFGIMEQQSGPNGWVNHMMAASPKPGQMRLWTFQSIAHGADFISYFRWRTATFGTEIYWHGLNDYANLPNRRLAELKRIHTDLQKLDGMAGTKYVAEVALLKDYDNEWDGELDLWHGPLTVNSDMAWFQASTYHHTPLDVVQLRDQTTVADLAKYKLIVYPHAAILPKERAELLEAYVAQGGTLVLGARTGYKELNGHCMMQAMPGYVRRLCGMRVTDFSMLPENDETICISMGGSSYKAERFVDILETESPEAQVLAVYENGYFRGQPAAVENAFGKGKALYFGSGFSCETAHEWMRHYNVLSPYASMVSLPACCELSVREGESGSFMTLLNYGGNCAEVDFHREMTNLLSGESCSGTYRLEPYGVMVMYLPRG